MTLVRQRLLAVFLLGLVIAGGWLAYAPALGGAFLLDDVSNLSGLSAVKDRLSALIFIFSGDAGPVGRPLALATFVLQADAWGGSAEPFLLVNILIHLANACLLSWVLYLLALAVRTQEDKALFVAVAGAAIWLFMPLLASSSLMIVQRMTTLSALFVLLGLAGYLYARRTVDEKPTRSLIGMSVSLVLGSSLAVLAKENGALLPTFVLVLEATVLVRPGSLGRSRWYAWLTLFLLLPTAIIGIYLASSVPYGHDLVLRRDFSGWERLLTQARILWEYLFNATIPQPGEFGPFRDGYPVARTLLSPVTLLAFTSWAVAFALALLWRRKYPLFALATLWFLGGHLLESTVLPLELYFEHRNYVPIIGPVFAVCAALARASVGNPKLVYSGVIGYVFVSALVLFSHTSLWGSPPTAARYWQEHFPDSVRAATAAAQYRLADEGTQSALDVLHSLAERDPQAGYVMIPALNLSCISAPEQDHGKEVADLHNLLGKVDFSYTAGTMLSELFTTISRIKCNGVNGETVRALAASLLSNPRYKNDASYRQLHHQIMARISRFEGKYELAIEHLEQAIAYRATPDLNMMMVTTYADARDFDAAREYMEAARSRPPFHPFKRFVWLSRLANLRHYVVQLEQHSGIE